MNLLLLWVSLEPADTLMKVVKSITRNSYSV